MGKESIVIVGGGIVGIFSALYLKKKYSKVVLVDKGILGGLLNSYNENGTMFDFGTHIPMDVMNLEIDKILFDSISEENWEIFNDLKVANYFLGKLDTNTVYPDLRKFDEQVFYNSFHQLLVANGFDMNNDVNLKDYYSSKFGELISENVYRKIIYKFTGKNLEELHYKNSRLFDINRIVVGENTLTKKLKQIPEYDDVIAEVKYDTTNSIRKMYYPKNNKGIGLWIDNLRNKLLQSEVIIKEYNSLAAIENIDSQVKKIVLEDGEVIHTNHLVWSLPTSLLMKALRVNNNKEKRIEFRKTLLINYQFDRDFLVESHYINCLDNKFKSFRITLYPNLTQTLKEKEIFNCTIELFLDNSEEMSDIYYEVVAEELLKMGVISVNHRVINRSFSVIGNGFPILNRKFMDEETERREFIENNYKNIVLVGKANIENFFMRDSLLDTYHQINKL
ncbi:FAD-dependent oxidoreductase [Solibacillus cecembensis]|uniref:FAD-dependent oxidoreductase n=1 Tax=Solibacillus cecembensis TaxID=459347 RepID=UPI003D02763E